MSNIMSMQALSEFGFIRYRTIDPNFATEFQSQTGWVLPDSYLDFLCFREPPALALTFSFVHANGDLWEGSLTELWNVAPHGDSLNNLAHQVINPLDHPNRAFLPIGNDAGGNYLYLDLSQTPPAVVDADSSTGMISTVAQDFDSFLRLLKPAE